MRSLSRVSSSALISSVDHLLESARDRFKSYIKAMLAIEQAGVSSRAEADKLLSETEPVSRHLRMSPALSFWLTLTRLWLAFPAGFARPTIPPHQL